MFPRLSSSRSPQETWQLDEKRRAADRSTSVAIICFFKHVSTKYPQATANKNNREIGEYNLEYSFEVVLEVVLAAINQFQKINLEKSKIKKQ
ncbi:hypothetical protein BSQ39_10650 [Loigolactobacillus backii]|uniref:Uncharacterized protein n=1 Tax=Loigolactobacillus backii TaxID=375175 RepID=A0A192GZZ1_9LACO|nr:hypothetical protein AYR52_01450 [Loigolactobacillus backii]ANK61286.1 hypothetical protein AYR53_00045 [Loigolactobacillus backii]ANK64035.1 hypothetical protein AYR54_01440 [Loigolactobacillus backii]ANK66483.1 hypothetical protein AYR55_01450 [Loigolactobacillus backii]ANK69514.1 hypothetical protein AYR56_04670 [Loigolactobacillus backii]